MQNIRCLKDSVRSDFRLGYATPHDVHAPFDVSVSLGTVLVPTPYSLGYTSSQLFRRVLFPQVALTAIPDLTTSMMVIMKALSLGFAIEVVDIFAQSQLTAALNFYYLEAFVIAVVIYMVIAYVVIQIADRLEQSLRVWT